MTAHSSADRIANVTLDKEIFLPYCGFEALWRRLHEIVYPKYSDTVNEPCIEGAHDRSEPAFDESEDSVGNGYYSKMRISLLLKLIFSASLFDFAEDIEYVPESLWSKENTGMLVALVRMLFDMHQCEKLVVMFYDDLLSIKSIYEGESREWFSCTAGKDRLMECIKRNAPSNMVMIHSHPGASLTVSDEDISFTQGITSYAGSLGSVLIEHFIVPCYGSTDDFIGILSRENICDDA